MVCTVSRYTIHSLTNWMILLQLNIHKFKAIARFGMMHCLATNVCVWVRTLVRESLKEINGHHPTEMKGHDIHDGLHHIGDKFFGPLSTPFFQCSKLKHNLLALELVPPVYSIYIVLCKHLHYVNLHITFM